MKANDRSSVDPTSRGPHGIPQEIEADAAGEIDRLAKMYADDFDEFSEEAAGTVSLEELSSSYARAIGIDDPASSTIAFTADDEIEIFDPLEEDSAKPHVPVSPLAIVESVLLVGRPDGSPISATEIAALMRGVSEPEVDQLIKQLNEDYVANHRALRIALVNGAYKMQLADELMMIRDQFLGPTREIRLNQAAIDCLALVAYQPGISREKLDEQRGQSSGTVLNQLVRRELLEVRREKVDKKSVPHYYPTTRLLALTGLESLEDLPTVEDWNG